MTAPPALITVEEFFDPPARSRAPISPDGTRVAHLAPRRDPLDPRVDRRHSDRVVAALRARGADVGYLLNEREGHWFVNPDSNIDVYGTLERFLARALGGRTTAEG